jgi:hypothetical protein
MALAKRENTGSDAIFVDLKLGTQKGEAGVGFRQVVGTSPNPNAGTPGAPKNRYSYDMHNLLTGRVTGFHIAEEPTYDDPTKKEMISYTSLTDEDNTRVVCRVPLASSSGRTFVGLVNAAVLSKQSAAFATYFFPVGSKSLDGTPSAKAKSYVNGYIGDPKGTKLTPTYNDASGKVMMDEKGQPARLPLGVEVRLGAGKTAWVFEEADNIAAHTAAQLLQHFAAEKEQASDNHDQGVDVNEAAAAAAAPSA